MRYSCGRLCGRGLEKQPFLWWEETFPYIKMNSSEVLLSKENIIFVCDYIPYKYFNATGNQFYDKLRWTILIPEGKSCAYSSKECKRHTWIHNFCHGSLIKIVHSNGNGENIYKMYPCQPFVVWLWGQHCCLPSPGLRVWISALLYMCGVHTFCLHLVRFLTQSKDLQSACIRMPIGACAGRLYFTPG